MQTETEDRIIVQRVYSLPMGKITVHLKGHKDSVVLSGVKTVQENEDADYLILYDYRKKIVGKFNKQEIAGWSFDED